MIGTYIGSCLEASLPSGPMSSLRIMLSQHGSCSLMKHGTLQQLLACVAGGFCMMVVLKPKAIAATEEPFAGHGVIATHGSKVENHL